MFGVVGRGHALGVEVDVKVDAAAAGTQPGLHVGQGLGRQLDPLQFLVRDAHALGVRSKTVKVEGHPARALRCPVPARAADALGVHFKGKLQFVVVPGRVAVGVLGQPYIPPLVDAIAVGRPLALHGLAVAGGDVDLGFVR